MGVGLRSAPWARRASAARTAGSVRRASLRLVGDMASATLPFEFDLTARGTRMFHARENHPTVARRG